MLVECSASVVDGGLILAFAGFVVVVMIRLAKHLGASRNARIVHIMVQ